MTNSPFFSDVTVEATLNAITALAVSGKLEIYSGAQPTDSNTAVGAQVLLATVTLGSPAFGSATVSGTAPSRVGTLTANAITAGTAVATGTAAWFRLYESNGTTSLMDGSVGTSGCDLNLSSTSITSGQSVSVTSFSITQPE